MQLGIGTGTLKIHLKHIFAKTGVHSRYRLAPIVAQGGPPRLSTPAGSVGAPEVQEAPCPYNCC